MDTKKQRCKMVLEYFDTFQQFWDFDAVPEVEVQVEGQVPEVVMLTCPLGSHLRSPLME